MKVRAGRGTRTLHDLLMLVAVVASTTMCHSDPRTAESPSVEHDSQTPAPRPDVVTFAGFDGVRLGEVRATADTTDICRFERPSGFPAGARIMLVNDTIVRVQIDSAGIPTEAGAAVGDPEPRVLELYHDRIVTEPHKYMGPTGHNLIVTDQADTLRRLVFETDGEKVIRYRVGLRPSVDWVEGCG